jgi:hypothetical protein
MAVIKNSPFESRYGFKSKNFTVDDQGNINASSLTLIQSDAGLASDFTITENVTKTEFLINSLEDENPTISLERTRSYTFILNTPTLTFTIFNPTTDQAYTDGIIHSDGSRGSDAVEKTSGSYTFRVPIDAPDVLEYRGVDSQSEDVVGTINVIDASGLFGSLQVTNETNSLDILTGALVVKGGTAIAKNLNVGGNITAQGIDLNGVGIPKLESNTNLELSATNKIIVKIDDVFLGEITNNGSSIPINNTTIENTTIGSALPATANFVSATIVNQPITTNSATNKKYVDTTATALAITFGL